MKRRSGADDKVTAKILQPRGNAEFDCANFGSSIEKIDRLSRFAVNVNWRLLTMFSTRLL